MFEWDEDKRRTNIAKHGIDFVEVTRFKFDRATIERDLRHDYGEPRLIATGPLGDRVHVLICVERDGLRIISLRKANARERTRWARAIGSSA